MSGDKSDKEIALDLIVLHYAFSVRVADLVVARAIDFGVPLDRESATLELASMIARDVGGIISMFMQASPDQIQRSLDIQRELLVIIEKNLPKWGTR